jgi:purine nucleosidase
MAADRLPLILDVDTGIDDALALALALASPDADLVAVTTVAGNVDVDQVTCNTLRVLNHLGANHVPVHRGASKPLVRELRHAGHFHGSDGLGQADIPPFDRPLGHDRGPAAVIRLALERPGELTWVCLGPLTNLAVALNVAPELPGLLRRVVVMGGAYTVGGNVTAHAEFNVFADPEAAAEVFGNRTLDLTVVGLDVTHRVVLPRVIWEAAAASDVPTAQLVAKLGPWMWRKHRKTGMYLHDPLAVAVALDPSLISCGHRSVTVGTGLANRGETLASRAGTVKIAETVDHERFLAEFGARLGLPRVSVAPEAVEAI